MANVAKKKNALLESLPALVLLGLLAGAVGGLGVGLIQLRATSQAASTASGKEVLPAASNLSRSVGMRVLLLFFVPLCDRNLGARRFSPVRPSQRQRAWR